jgi:hypothetical protein
VRGIHRYTELSEGFKQYTVQKNSVAMIYIYTRFDMDWFILSNVDRVELQTERLEIT